MLDLNTPTGPEIMEPSLRGLSVGELLEIIFDEAAARGIVIFLDLHWDLGQITELWYSDRFSYSDFQRGWLNVVEAFKRRWNFLGVDLVRKMGTFRGMKRSGIPAEFNGLKSNAYVAFFCDPIA